MHDSQAWNIDPTPAVADERCAAGAAIPAFEEATDWAALGRLVLAEARRRATRARQVRAAGDDSPETDQAAGAHA